MSVRMILRLIRVPAVLVVAWAATAPTPAVAGGQTVPAAFADPRAAASASQGSPAGVNPAGQAPVPTGPVPVLPATICNQTVPEPARLPPANSGPVLTAVMLCFEKQGGSPVIEANTYLYYIQAKGSRPSLNEWIRYDDSVQQVALADFKRLMATNFLDDLLVEVRDVRYANITIIEGNAASQFGIGIVSARIAEAVLRDGRLVGSVRLEPLASIVKRNLPAFRENLTIGSNPVCMRCVCSMRTGWRSAPWQ